MDTTPLLLLFLETGKSAKQNNINFNPNTEYGIVLDVLWTCSTCVQDVVDAHNMYGSTLRIEVRMERHVPEETGTEDHFTSLIVSAPISFRHSSMASNMALAFAMLKALARRKRSKELSSSRLRISPSCVRRSRNLLSASC